MFTNVKLFCFQHFFRGFFLSITIWSHHQILHFFNTHIKFFENIFSGSNLSLFANYNANAQKGTLLKFLLKTKFFCQYLSNSFWFFLNFHKSILIKLPNVHVRLHVYTVAHVYMHTWRHGWDVVMLWASIFSESCHNLTAAQRD